MDETTRPIPEVGSSTILVEHAQPEDAEEIMRIKRAAWIAAYPNEDYDVSTVDVQNKFTEEDVITGTQNWQNGIAGETDAGKRWTFVARLGGKVVGFSSPAIEDGQCRIGQLYVSPDFHRQGIGSELLKKALEWHGDAKDIYLHVVKYNGNAINLYKSFGFEATGKEFPAEEDEQGLKLLPEIEMLRKAVH